MNVSSLVSRAQIIQSERLPQDRPCKLRHDITAAVCAAALR
jgi:hypothetical protein